jgi:hypothetical protein
MEEMAERRHQLVELHEQSLSLAKEQNQRRNSSPAGNPEAQKNLQNPVDPQPALIFSSIFPAFSGNPLESDVDSQSTSESSQSLSTISGTYSDYSGYSDPSEASDIDQSRSDYSVEWQQSNEENFSERDNPSSGKGGRKGTR